MKLMLMDAKKSFMKTKLPQCREVNKFSLT